MKTLIIDTNVTYLIADVEINNKVNLEELKFFIKNNKTYITAFTLFELLNSSKPKSDVDKIFKCLMENNIKVFIKSEDRDIAEYLLAVYQSPPKSVLRQDIKLKCGEWVIEHIYNNLSFFIVSYAYTTSTLVLLNYKQGDTADKIYFKEKFEIYQHDIDRYVIKTLKERLYALLGKDEFHAGKNQEVIMLIIANLMTYYHELMKNAKELFESGDKCAYYKLTKRFKQLRNLIIKDKLDDPIKYEQKYLSVCGILQNGFKKHYGDLKKGNLDTLFFNRIMNTIVYPDSMSKNEFEDKWTGRLIKSLLINNGKIQFNDFIDYEILRYVYYLQNHELLITFDNKMITIMSEQNTSNRFTESLSEINKLIKNNT